MQAHTHCIFQMKHAHLGIIIDKTVFLNWQHRILKHTNHPTTTGLPRRQIIPPHSANSRAFQVWKQPKTNYLPEGGTHICLICQHIITEPITNSELTARWQGGQSAVHVCVWAERICSLQVRAPSPTPLGNRSRSGQPETPWCHPRESTGYRQSVRKCTRPKVNITQLLGLIVFTVEQLRWITGLVDKSAAHV